MKSIFLYNLAFIDLDTAELEEVLEDALSKSTCTKIATPNPEFILQAKKDKSFFNLLKRSEILLPDGVGIRYAFAALTDDKLKHRHSGVDAVELLVKLAEKTQSKILFFGGDPSVAEIAAAKLKEKYPNAPLDFFDPGPIEGNTTRVQLSESLIDVIERKFPQILVIALGQGKQEQFAKEITEALPNIKITIGVGGAFDMIAEVLPRAPEWMQRTGLEWVWRLILEPKRFNRIYRAVIAFPITVAWDSIKAGRILQALPSVFKEVFTQLKK